MSLFNIPVSRRVIIFGLLLVAIAIVTKAGLVFAAAVTRPMEVEVRTHIKILKKNPKGKWVRVDEVGPTNARFNASLLEMANGKNITSGFVFRTTSKKGKPYSARLLDKAEVNLNPVTGQLNAKLTYEVKYDGMTARVPAQITTESRSTPSGRMNGARVKGLLGKNKTSMTVVSANTMSIPGSSNTFLLVCKEQYKMKPKK